jgi:hypothetical protein
MDFVTTSVDWVPVPTMTINVRLSRGRPSDLIAFFSAISATLEPNSIVVRTRLDQGIIAFPDEMQFSGMIPASVRDWAADCHSYPFVFQNVDAGSHTVTAEFRSVQPGKQVIISRPSLVVAYE